MKPYTVFKHDGSSHPPPFDLVEFDCDAEARAFALNLLDTRPDYQAVEVWDGVGNPIKIERASAEY